MIFTCSFRNINNLKNFYFISAFLLEALSLVIKLVWLFIQYSLAIVPSTIKVLKFKKKIDFELHLAYNDCEEPPIDNK